MMNPSMPRRGESVSATTTAHYKNQNYGNNSNYSNL
jgi:hypothetical protein